MQLIVLAGGKGTRMRPLTDSTPKSLVPLSGKPLVTWSLEQIPETITEIIFVVGYLAEQIERQFGNEYLGRPVRYVHHDGTTGTGSAVAACQHLIQGRFMVMMGDDLYSRVDMDACIAAGVNSILVQKAHPTDHDIFLIRDEKGCFSGITRIFTDAEHEFTNAALYVLEENFFQYPLISVSSRGNTELALLPTVLQMSSQTQINLIVAQHHMRISDLNDLAAAEKMLMSAPSVLPWQKTTTACDAV